MNPLFQKRCIIKPKKSWMKERAVECWAKPLIARNIAVNFRLVLCFAVVFVVQRSQEEIGMQVQGIARSFGIVSRMGEALDYSERIEQFRKRFQNPVEDLVFDRAIFESVIEEVIIGSYDNDGNPDPAIITFIFKSDIKGENDLILEGLKPKEKPPIDKDNPYDKRNLIPNYVEIFSFDQKNDHTVFNRTQDNAMEKTIKHSSEVRVAIAI